MLDGGRQSQLSQPAGMGSQVCSMPSSGPQPWWQYWPIEHVPEPHGNSGQKLQSAIGPSTHTPPSHTIAPSQQA